ncbi:MAG: YIP1 family protein [Bacteroidales bacterium]|nr:YIP1 family protein [Bacteroidales bacterium]
MEIKKLLLRSRNLLIAPGDEFDRIRHEMQSVAQVNKNYVIPVALLVTVSSLFGSAFSNFFSPINSFIYIGVNTVITFLLVITHTYVSGKAIALLGKNTCPGESRANFYALNAYAQLPFFLSLAIIKLFPSLVFVIILGLYSGFLLYSGSNKLTRVPNEKQLQFTILSILIMIAVFIISSEIYTLLYSEIVIEFSTFAAD